MKNSKDKIIYSILILVVFFAGLLVLVNKSKVVQINLNSDVTSGWQTMEDSTNNLTFKYPETLSTTYITPVDWPPIVQVINKSFTCNEAGDETTPGGQTYLVNINGNDYCASKLSEGAAGSTYTLYAYGTELKNKMAFFSFSLKFVQCGNFSEPEKTACEVERNSFDIDTTINQIIQSAKFSS